MRHGTLPGTIQLNMRQTGQSSAKTLLLFSYGWGELGFAQLARAGQQLDHRGFNLLRFPSNAALLTFDMDSFVNRLARQAKTCGWSAVFSHHEQFGALAAALLAKKMHWPGTPPQAVVACQHKLYARQVLDQVCPEANTAYQRLPVAYGQLIPDGLTYPCFVKPIKAAFSVLARVVHSREELQHFMRFGLFELWVIKRMVEPFEKVATRLLRSAGTAHCLLLETPVDAPQYCLDGVVFDGQIEQIGVVAAVMYPGTQAFMRFDYPSGLAASAQSQALDVARKFLKAINFTHGFFNMEFFYDAATGKLTVIEFNPRMASQFADLYARVDGLGLFAMALELAHGRNPWDVPRKPSSAAVATSAVFRVFDNKHPQFPQHSPLSPTMPTLAQTTELQSRYPDHLLFQYPKVRQSLARDFKWLGSYRYGILHMGGQDDADLRAKCANSSDILGWLLPYADKVAQRTPSL